MPPNRNSDSALREAASALSGRRRPSRIWPSDSCMVSSSGQRAAPQRRVSAAASIWPARFCVRANNRQDSMSFGSRFTAIFATAKASNIFSSVIMNFVNTQCARFDDGSKEIAFE